MDATQTMSLLKTQGEAIVQLYADVDAAMAAWRPAPQRWSLLEILCHLADEEREDFRQRLRLTLEDPTQPWPPIDPPAWVTQRNYGERDLRASVADFRSERARSLRWLSGLVEPDWSRAYEHPRLGPLRAGDLLVSWLAHDLLHLRQIANTRREWVAHRAAPYSTAYAEPQA